MHIVQWSVNSSLTSINNKRLGGREKIRNRSVHSTDSFKWSRPQSCIIHLLYAKKPIKLCCTLSWFAWSSSSCGSSHPSHRPSSDVSVFCWFYFKFFIAFLRKRSKKSQIQIIKIKNDKFRTICDAACTAILQQLRTNNSTESSWSSFYMKWWMQCNAQNGNYA